MCIFVSEKSPSQAFEHLSSQLLRRLRQKNHLSPGVEGQPKQHSKTPSPNKKKQQQHSLLSPRPPPGSISHHLPIPAEAPATQTLSCPSHTRTQPQDLPLCSPPAP